MGSEELTVWNMRAIPKAVFQYSSDIACYTITECPHYPDLPGMGREACGPILGRRTLDTTKQNVVESNSLNILGTK
jgi:hypothetical protein